MESPASMADRLIRGDRTAMARMISWAENGDRRFAGALASIYDRVGRGWRVGITGPPGAGKSTLVNEMARLLRARGETVGVLAIDPSSPFSGGALLGDRIRMEERTLDRGVFIRSMASRGSHGGLARAAVDACDVMDAFGLDSILLETVGVGQAEYDVVGAADTVLVVLCPGAGDGIQAMKAGLLEVADVLVVNKADLEGADRLALDLSEAARARSTPLEAWREGWTVPVVACSAGTGSGIEGVIEAVDRHREHVESKGLERVRRSKRLEQVRHAVAEGLAQELWSSRGYGAWAERRLGGSATPHEISASLLATILAHVPPAPGDGNEREDGRI